jgi:hypothetical protein
VRRGVLSMEPTRPMARRALLKAVAASLVAVVAAACGGGDRRGDAPPRNADRQDQSAAPQDGAGAPSPRRPRGCPVTLPNHRIPPGQEQNPGAAEAPYFGNGRLWTVLDDNGILRRAPRRDGSVAEKRPWWRAVRGRLRITGRRLDAPAPSLRAHIPDGYGLTSFQASEIIFPTAGCWSVTGAAGAASLRFVTLVVKATGR